MPNQQTLKFTIRQDGYVTEEASADTIKAEQNARWDALNKFMKHQFVVEF